MSNVTVIIASDKGL